jgi:hypothetical protein
MAGFSFGGKRISEFVHISAVTSTCCQQRPWHHINKQLVDDQQSCFRPIYNKLALIIFGSKRLITEVEKSLG